MEVLKYAFTRLTMDLNLQLTINNETLRTERPL